MKRALEVALTLAVLLACSVAMPAAAEESQPSAAAEAEAAPMPVYGLQMWKDAETGELRGPTAEEAAQISVLLQRMFGHRKAAPQVVTDKSGMLSVELDESMLEFTVMRKAPDGSLEVECVDDAHDALEFIGMPAETAPEEE